MRTRATRVGVGAEHPDAEFPGLEGAGDVDLLQHLRGCAGTPPDWPQMTRCTALVALLTDEPLTTWQ